MVGGRPGGGVACRCCEGRLVSGAVPPPTARPLGWAAGVPRPECPGCGRCGFGNTAPAPPRAPLRAGVARRAGCGRASPGGVPYAVVRGVCGQALPLPRLPALWAGHRGPLPTGCGCGGVRAWGPVTNPTARALASWLCALFGRHGGARGGRLLPGCGASGVKRSPTPHCPPSGGAAGAQYPVAVGAGGCGRGDPSPTPQRALLRAGFARCGGARRGCLFPGCGASGVRRSPTPDCPPSGWAAGAHHPLAVGAGGCGRGDPSPTPQRALLRAGFARCGRGTRAPGGGSSCLGVGRPGSGALPSPTARPLGGLPGPTTHWLWVRGVAGVGTCYQPHSARSCVLWGRHEGARGGRLLPGCGTSGVGSSPTPDCPPSGRAAGAHYPLALGAEGCGRGDASPTPQRALLRADFARCGGGMRVPGVGASCLGSGASGSGALPPPTARPLSGLPGPTTHWLWVRGAAGVGTRHQPHSARSCELALRAVGAARGRPEGSPPAWVCGVRGRALSHPRLPALLVGGPGPRPTGCGCGGVRAWGPVTNPTVRALACCGGGMRVPGGGASCLGSGASGVGRSPTPDCPPSERAAGAHYPLAVGAGGCGRGDPSPTPQRALACCGGGMRVPGLGASCLGVGRPGLGALPPPTARTLGGLPGPTTHWLGVRGGAGVGSRHQPHSARSCELALRAVGAARERPGGAPPA